MLHVLYRPVRVDPRRSWLSPMSCSRNDADNAILGIPVRRFSSSCDYMCYSPCKIAAQDHSCCIYNDRPAVVTSKKQ